MGCGQGSSTGWSGSGTSEAATSRPGRLSGAGATRFSAGTALSLVIATGGVAQLRPTRRQPALNTVTALLLVALKAARRCLRACSPAGQADGASRPGEDVAAGAEAVGVTVSLLRGRRHTRDPTAAPMAAPMRASDR